MAGLSRRSQQAAAAAFQRAHSAQRGEMIGRGPRRKSERWSSGWRYLISHWKGPHYFRLHLISDLQDGGCYWRERPDDTVDHKRQ